MTSSLAPFHLYSSTYLRQRELKKQLLELQPHADTSSIDQSLTAVKAILLSYFTVGERVTSFVLDNSGEANVSLVYIHSIGKIEEWMDEGGIDLIFTIQDEFDENGGGSFLFGSQLYKLEDNETSV